MRGLIDSLWARLLLGYWLPVLLFIGAALVAYVTIQRLLIALEREKGTQTVLTRIQVLQDTISSMSAAKRAHHLLGDAEFEQQFWRKRQELTRNLDALRALTREDPAQTQALDQLIALEQQWNDLAVADFKLFNDRPREVQGGLEKLITQLQLRRAIGLLNQIRDQVSRIEATEQQRLELRRRDVQATTRESIWAIASGVVVAVVLSVLIAWRTAQSITRPIRQLQESAAELRKGRFTMLAPSGPAEVADLIHMFNLSGIALSQRTALLESSEHRYRTIVGTTASIMWTTSPAGDNADMSQWCQFTGQDEQAARGEGWLDAVHPDDRGAFQQRWRDAIARRHYWEEEVRVRHQDGSYRTLDCRSVPILNDQGELLEWVRICDDITERKKQEALHKEKEAAEAANRAKSEFIARMSHELRTPLNAIIGMSNLLATRRFGDLTAKQADYLADISQAGEHLCRLINDILDLSRVEVGRLEIRPEPTPVAATIEQVLSSIRPLAESKRLQLWADLPEADATLSLDPARFKQVLYNLLSNGVKFTPAGGRLGVRCAWVYGTNAPEAAVSRAQAAALRIDVLDTGIGIAEQDQARIGSDYFQVPGSQGPSPDGAGLGLALSRRLVQMMGGSFWFASKLGQGSCFSFSLPVKEAATVAAPKQTVIEAAERPCVHQPEA